MFASPADLAQFLQTATQAEADAGDPNVLDTAQANQALESATADIITACGWPIMQEVNATLTTWASGKLLLPTLYLTAVSITDAAAVTVSPSLYSWEEWGEVCLWGTWWARSPVINTGTTRPQRITITYTHGYTVVPAAVKTVCLEVAAGYYTNPLKLASTSRLGAVDVFRRSDAGAGGLDTDSRLDPYRRAAV